MAKDELNVTRLSKLLSIPRDRIYKWINEGAQPRYEDRLTIEAWLDGKFYNEIGDKSKNKALPDGKITPERALLKVLVLEFANYKAQKEGLDPEVILKDIESKASAVFAVLKDA